MVFCSSECRNLCDPESSYDCDHFSTDVSTKFSCCVAFDSDELEDVRFCSCKRSSKDKQDWLDCGYYGQEEDMDAAKLRSVALKRRVRWMYVLQAVFWTLIGGIVLINPEAFAFHVAISTSNIKTLNMDGYRQFQSESMLAKVDADADPGFTLTGLLSRMSVGGIFSKIMESEAATPTEKEVFMKTMDDVSKEMRLEAARAAIIVPTKIMGAGFIFFGVHSLMQRFNSVELGSSISTTSMTWNGCMIVGLAAAASGANGNFVIFMIIVCVASLICWFFIRDGILQMNAKLKIQNAAVLATRTAAGQGVNASNAPGKSTHPPPLTIMTDSEFLASN